MTWPPHDESGHTLAPLLVGESYDRTLLYLRPLVELLFHLTRIDVLTACNNEVFESVHNVEIAGRVEQADVAGAEPLTLPECGTGLFGIVQVAFHDVATAHADLTFPSLIHEVPRFIPDLDFHP